jgi:radical SAM superfamily enzyme YgiQ (UPF0313 family)
MSLPKRKKDRKTTIYLADLSHTGQIVSANVHPLGIGIIAAYALKEHQDSIEIELFKYPEDLTRALENKTPDIMGFANYSWNLNIAYDYSQRIKGKYPGVAIVFGGPNYGLTEEEISDFWGKHPAIDFYLVREGEVAFAQLISTLRDADFDIAAVKNKDQPPANAHFFNDGKLIQGEMLPRIRNLNEIPSPYLEGLMDKFFDSILIPMMHTTRGCPFTCTFCTEGDRYYAKVTKRFELLEELEYIAERITIVPDLVITDANFGMFIEDIDKAKDIALTFNKYGWPKHIQVAGGKNQKDRLLEVATILQGRMDISASMQSTDAEVLANIKRSNISYGELADLGERSHKINARSFVEIILGLPGDSVRAHRQSLVDSTMSGVALVRMHQLIMLPQTEMMVSASRKKYGIETKYRVATRSFGKYSLYGENFISVEFDEICVSQNSMSFDEYLECRMLDLTVELIHNGKIFRELFDLSGLLGLDWPKLIFDFYDRREKFPSILIELYETFKHDSGTGLWDSREELDDHVKSNIDHYLETSEGVNQLAISNAKARSFFFAQEELHNCFYDEFVKNIKDNKMDTLELLDFVEQLKTYSLMRKTDILNTDLVQVAYFDYDFSSIFEGGAAPDYRKLKVANQIEVSFQHDKLQKDTIDGYGATLAGLGSLLMKVPVHRIMRVGYVGSREIGDSFVTNASNDRIDQTLEV